MERLTVFPYHAQAEVLLQNQEQLADYEFAYMCSFTEDEERLEICNSRYGISVGTDFVQALQASDGLLLLEPMTSAPMDAYRELIAIAKQMQKKILCSQQLWKLMEVSAEVGSIVYPLKENVYLSSRYVPDRLTQIALPVIMVGGMGESCSKFELQLQLKKYLKEQGYEAIFIASNPIGKLFGMHTVPEQLFDKHIPFEEQVYYFNHFVHSLCEGTDADVLVIGLPGGLSTLGDECVNHFSDIACIMTNAVQADAGIISVYFDLEYSRDFLKSFREYCYYKYNIPVIGLCMARERLRYDLERRAFDIYNLPKEMQENLFSLIEPNDVLRSIVNSTDMKKVFDDAIASLMCNPVLV